VLGEGFIFYFLNNNNIFNTKYPKNYFCSQDEAPIAKDGGKDDRFRGQS